MVFASFSCSWSFSYALNLGRVHESPTETAAEQKQERSSQNIRQVTFAAHAEDAHDLTSDKTIITSSLACDANKQRRWSERQGDAESLQILEAHSITPPTAEQEDRESLAILMHRTRHMAKRRVKQASRKTAKFETPEKTSFWPKDLRKKVLPEESSTDFPELNTPSMTSAFGGDAGEGSNGSFRSYDPLSGSLSSAWDEANSVAPVEEMDDFWMTDAIGSGSSTDKLAINGFIELCKSSQISGPRKKKDVDRGLPVVSEQTFDEDANPAGGDRSDGDAGECEHNDASGERGWEKGGKETGPMHMRSHVYAPSMSEAQRGVSDESYRWKSSGW